MVRAGQILQIKGITDQDQPLLFRAIAGGCLFAPPARCLF